MYIGKRINMLGGRTRVITRKKTLERFDGFRRGVDIGVIRWGDPDLKLVGKGGGGCEDDGQNRALITGNVGMIYKHKFAFTGGRCTFHDSADGGLLWPTGRSWS
jgi:hypothetical protein